MISVILEQYDHHFLIFDDDPRYEKLKEIDPQVLGLPYNPTAEALALDIQDEVFQGFFTGYPVNNTVFVEALNHYEAGQPVILDVTVQLWETDDCSAIASTKDRDYFKVEEGADNSLKLVATDFRGLDAREARIKLFEPLNKAWQAFTEERFDFSLRKRNRLWIDCLREVDRDYSDNGGYDPYLENPKHPIEKAKFEGHYPPPPCYKCHAGHQYGMPCPPEVLEANEARAQETLKDMKEKGYIE